MTYRLLRLPEVLDKTGFSRSWTYKLIAQGEFPKPIKTGSRSIAFIETEINEWIERRVNQSRPSNETV